jgi:hypothetical protein
MRYYIPFILLLPSCGGIAIDPPTDSETSALTCSAPTCRGSVTNGIASLPSENNYFCHPIMMSGSGAHSQAPNLGWGLPAWGGLAGVWASNSAPSMSAIPNSGHQGSPKQGQMVIEAQCDQWSRFGGNGTHGYSPQWTYSWNHSGIVSWIDTNSGHLWDINSACYVTSAGSLSFSNELVGMSQPNWWNWQLDMQGFKTYSATARCAWLGRNLGAVNYLDTAVHGNFADSGLAVGSGICLIYHVEGNLDDGYVNQNRATGTWRLEISGGVTRAKMYCFAY